MLLLHLIPKPLMTWIFVEIDIVNKIRPRVKAWRGSKLSRVTGIYKRLLEHWQDPEERCKTEGFLLSVEAIETLIWLDGSTCSG